MSKADSLIIEAIRQDGALDEDDFIIEAIVMYVAIKPDQPGHHRYGKFFLGDSMPCHHAIGLIDTIREMIYDFHLLGEEPEEGLE